MRQAKSGRLTVKDSKKLLHSNRHFEMSPGTIHCEWSAPIETKGMTVDDLPRLKQMAREEMLKVLEATERIQASRNISAQS